MQTLINKNIFIAVLLSLLPAIAMAQVKIHGKVTDTADGQPMEFVTVRIAGTATGTQTNRTGDYNLSCPATDSIKIIFSFIGYREEARTFINPKVTSPST